MSESLAKLLTVAEAARILGCSDANVYAHITAGRLPFVSVGTSKGYRIDPKDLIEFIRKRKVRNEGEKPKARRPQLKLRHIKL